MLVDPLGRETQALLLPVLQVGGVQWKPGVVIYTMFYTRLLYNTTRIHCTPLPLHPPLPSIHSQCWTADESMVMSSSPGYISNR